MTDASPSLLLVLVLYKVRPLACPTLITLCHSLRETNVAARVKLLIYDNSPTPNGPPEGIPIEHWYLQDAQNSGLAAAYNAALKVALKDRIDWLLLLDQDTEITPQYLLRLDKLLPTIAADFRVAAIVPKLRCGGSIVSPAQVLWGGFLAPINANFSGVVPFEATALNSGTVLRVSAIQHIGGFDSQFWLDYLDHWMFNQLHRAGFRVYVMDILVQHELSVANFASMSDARYKNILSAEGLFYQTCKSRAEQKLYLLRVMGRAAKMLLQARGWRLFRATVNHIAGLLMHRK
jgi:GT2 family glycosyltransferase